MKSLLSAITIGLITVLTSQTSLAANEIKLSKAKCLDPAADVILNWLSENDAESDYHIFRDNKGYPVEIKDIEEKYSRLDLMGIWRVGANQELVQYGDGSGVVFVTMTYNPKLKTCTAGKVDVGQDDGDLE